MATPSQRFSSSQSQKKMSLPKPKLQSQHQSPIALDNLLSMPLAKYSYATTVALQSKPPWTHLPDRDNMFAVLDLVSATGAGGSVNQRNILKVVRASDLIECIDLDDLQQQALRDEDCARFMNFQDADRLVLIIVKVPLLAIRYPLPNGQIRRLQMKFVQEYDYTMTVSLLQRLKLPIRDPNPTSRPQTALSYNSSTAQPRPANAAPQPHEAHLSSQRANISAPPSRDIAAARSSSVMLGSNPILGSGHITRLAQPSATLHRSTSMFDHGSRDELLPPARPSSSSITLDTVPNLRHAPSGPTGLLSDKHFGPSGPILESPVGIATSHRSVGGVFESSAVQASSTPPMSRRALFVEELAGASRSLDAGFNNNDNLDQLLPPKRDLPFAKPKSKPPSREALPALQPTSSSDPLWTANRMGLKKPATTTASKLDAKAKHPTSAAVGPKFFSTDLSATECSKNTLTSSFKPSTPLPSSIYAWTDVPPSSPPVAYVVGNRPLPSLIPAGENQRNPGRPQGPTEQTTKLVDNEVSDEYFARIDAFLQKHHNRPLAETYFDGAAAGRAAFAALPEAERLAAIDAEIVECIMDDDFLQLCEDVDKSWKRIALGF